MNVRSACVLVSLAWSCLGPAAPAQTVFDHFAGSVIDTSLWWPWGNPANIAQSGSKLQLRSPPRGEEFGLVSMDAFRGDFDFTLDFAKHASSPMVGEDVFQIAVLDASGRLENLGFVEIGVSQSATARGFYANAERNHQGQGSAFVASTATAGELRLTRSGTLYTALYRENNAWRTLKTWTGVLGDLVYVEIMGGTAPTGTFYVEFDRLTYSAGARVASPQNYGTDCFLSARPWSVPFLGNSDYGIFVKGDRRLASAPLLLLLGFSQLSADLTALGAPGCSLYASPDFVTVAGTLTQDAEGVAYLPIPNDTRLVSATFYDQLVAAAPLNTLQLVWSNGVATTIVKP